MVRYVSRKRSQICERPSASPTVFLLVRDNGVLISKSNGWRKATVISPPFQEQFETRKLRRRRFFAWFAPFEQFLGVPCEFEKLDTLLHIRPVCGFVPLYIAEASGLVCSLSGRHPVIEISVE